MAMVWATSPMVIHHSTVMQKFESIMYECEKEGET
jgi:hypothetical protein